MEQTGPKPRDRESTDLSRQSWGPQGDVICDPDNSDGWIKFDPDGDEVDLSSVR